MEANFDINMNPVPSTKVNCTEIGLYESNGCNIPGYYCTFKPVFNVRTYLIYDGNTVPNSANDETCLNITEAAFCNPGYYCPSQFEKYKCPKGSYCNIGFSSPMTCAWGKANCPDEMMSSSDSDVSLVLFILFLFVLLFGFKLLILRHIKSKLAKYERITHDAHASALEQEQQLVLAIQFKKLINRKQGQRIFNGELFANFENSEALFDKIDSDKSGFIESNELNEALRGEGNYITDSEVKEMVTLFDTSKDGKLSRQEFNELRSHIFSQDIETEEKKLNAIHDNSDETFRKISEPLNVSFTQLNLFLGNGDPVLQNVAGSVKAFNVTALMGPSGAGKTSLLNLLRGQAHYAKVQGNIYINGVSVESLNDYSNRMAFVPQDDIMNDELTVEENILFAAVLFNKRGITHRSKILPFVHYIEDLLCIEFIRNSIVGSAELKGISGGQKKRVSVAMEMTKEAALFFLDEPTSGLDSATSMSLLNSLQKVSKKGVNIVATLHQSRQEIFDLLDCLILLAPGGKISYFGPDKGMAQHFSNMRYTSPPAANVTDFVMDVLAGFVRKDGEVKVQPVKEIVKEITEVWEKNYQYQEPIASGKRPTQSSYEQSRSFITNWLAIYQTSIHREFKIYERTFSTVIRTSISLAVLGFLIALLFGSVALKLTSKGQPATPSIGGQISSAQLAFGLIIMTSGLKLFGHDHLVRLREESAGVMLIPLYLGKLGASVFELVFYTYAFISGYYPLVQSNALFSGYFSTFILLQLAIMGLANLISIAFTSSIKALVASGVLVVFWAFGGITPSYPDILERTGPLVILVI